MPTEIVKVQVPLGTTDPNMVNQCLVYDRRRRRECFTPLTDELHKKLRGDLKGYFNATWSSVVGWAIADRVADQNW